VLNSNCGFVSCASGSEQEQWLRDDLAAHPATCTLAYFHHPRFNSGAVHGNNTAVQPLWQALYDAGADVILSGHEHLYERFAPQTPAGAADPARGIRQFTVGTGGRGLYSFGPIKPNSEVRNNSAFGVLRLTLGAASYGWQFVPVAGSSFGDAGTAACH
jgi:acid phosphatase type 7